MDDFPNETPHSVLAEDIGGNGLRDLTGKSGEFIIRYGPSPGLGVVKHPKHDATSSKGESLVGVVGGGELDAQIGGDLSVTCLKLPKGLGGAGTGGSADIVQVLANHVAGKRRHS